MFLKQYTTKKDQLTGRIICYGPQNHHEEPQRETKEIRQVRNWMIIVVCAAVILAVVALIVIRAGAEEKPISCWILCKPGSQVNIRRTPGKDGIIDGFMEVGDEFRTDGTTRNGYVKAIGIGENGTGWIYCGFVVTDKPEASFENYVCVARNRAACRRWCDGPQISGRIGWLYNGSSVQVFYRSDEWCVTNRGYIKTAWLEVDPEI